MIPDEILIPHCKRLAKKFLHQASHLGAPEDVLNELINVAYACGKAKDNIDQACSWMFWKLMHYVTMPSKEIKRGSFRLSDLRNIKWDVEAPPDEIIQEEDLKDYLLKTLKTLPFDDLLLIILYYGKDKSFEEIGKILGISRFGVKKRNERILEEIRKKIGE